MSRHREEAKQISVEEARENLEKLKRKREGPNPDEVLRRQQYELRQLFDEDDVDWDKFMEYQTLEGINPNFVQPSSLISTLHMSAYANQAQVVHWCVETGADVDAKSTLGRTPLHFACDGNAVRTLRYLLEARADPNAVSLSLMTPLHFCCRNGNQQAVSVLLDCACTTVDINATDSKHRRPDMLSKDSAITKAIDKYRRKFNQKQKQELLEYKLLRLFKAFDKDGTGCLDQIEWAKAQAILAEYFVGSCEEAISEILQQTDKDNDNRISFEEFRSSQLEMMNIAGSPHNQLMANLTDIEHRLFEDSTPDLQREASSQLEVMRRDSGMCNR